MKRIKFPNKVIGYLQVSTFYQNTEKNEASILKFVNIRNFGQVEADNVSWRGNDEGGKLKETGTTSWSSPNTGATNESGFIALPGGQRSRTGFFFVIGEHGYWWSSTEHSLTNAWYRLLYYNSSIVYRYTDGNEAGFSVRCIKD